MTFSSIFVVISGKRISPLLSAKFPASMASMVLETQAHLRSTRNSWPSALCGVGCGEWVGGWVGWGWGWGVGQGMGGILVSWLIGHPRQPSYLRRKEETYLISLM